MNAEAAAAHPSRLIEDAVTPVELAPCSAITILSSHRAVFVGRCNGGEYWCRCGQWFLTPDLLVGHLSDQVEAPFGSESEPGR